MAIGRDFPEGAGIALYAMRGERLPFTSGNIKTLLGTVVVRDGRFVDSDLGLRTLLCGQRAAYPNGARIEIVAADTARFDGLDGPRVAAELRAPPRTWMCCCAIWRTVSTVPTAYTSRRARSTPRRCSRGR